MFFHYHPLIETPQANPKQIMQNINASYRVFLNRRYKEERVARLQFLSIQGSILRTIRSPGERTSVLLPASLTRDIWLITERKPLGFSQIHFLIEFND
jgi:hypothetical protein